MQRNYTRKIFETIAVIIVFGLVSCNSEHDNEPNNKLLPDPVVPEEYSITIESITDYQNICGKWKLAVASGGFWGETIIPDYNRYFEIRESYDYSFSNDSAKLEYGKFQLFKDSKRGSNSLLIELIRSYDYEREFPNFNEVDAIYLIGNDSLVLSELGTDSYNYLYLRVK